MTSGIPQSQDPRTGGDGSAPPRRGRAGRKIVLAVIALLIVLTIAVWLTRVVGSSNPSGHPSGRAQGVGPSVTWELPGAG